MASHWCSLLPDYALLADSEKRRVVVHGKLKKEQAKVDRQHYVVIIRWMKIWTTDVVGGVPPEKFKFQARFTEKGFHPVAIWVFKAHQPRYYGFTRVVEGKETFFVTAIDPAKKQDDANPEVLARAGREAFRILKLLGLQ